MKTPQSSESLAETLPIGSIGRLFERMNCFYGARFADMWVLLTEFSRQLEWLVNGRLERLAPEEWKDILTAAFRREVPRVAMGLDGGMVLLGARTSRFTKREMSDFLEFLHSAVAERGVVIAPPVPEVA
ncbi:MAG: recombination protein NinB [Zoogloeaceae bacterium]|jgi:hypothetical protein|nr:recombination protein NinB [Zoogloeaceae bacterium]